MPTPSPAMASAGEQIRSCPQYGCQGTLHPYPTAQSSYDFVTGLEHLRCSTCGHAGMRPRNGVQLICRDRDQHVFPYAPSLARLTIEVSPTVLRQFTRHNISEVPALTFIADGFCSPAGLTASFSFMATASSWMTVTTISFVMSSSNNGVENADQCFPSPWCSFENDTPGGFTDVR
jgi:hypothetical protein